MGRSRQEAIPAPRLSDQELQRIIQNDEVSSAQLMVEKAREYGTYLKEAGLKTAQIRGIFGHVRQIEMNWNSDESEPTYARQSMRELVLLKPKMAYQGERVKEVKPLAELLSRGIDLVSTNRDHFQRFVDFFEAILAYHKAAGGKD